MALSDLQVGDYWSQMVTSMQLHVDAANIERQIRHGGPDLALQHSHQDVACVSTGELCRQVADQT